MSGFFSETSLSPNRLERAKQERQKAGLKHIDLTCSNPTLHGIAFPAKPLAEAASRYFENRSYEPSARGLFSARNALASYYQRRKPPLLLHADQIFITASTSEGYRLLLSLLCEPGDNILVPNVGYPLLELIAADQRVELRSYVLERTNNHWDIQAGSLLRAKDERTRAVVIISPHNPCGLVVKSSYPEFDALGLPLIVDEVFASFPQFVAEVPCIGALQPQLPIFTLNGISKMFALPDLKLGWIALNESAYSTFGDHLELLNDIYLSANSLTQALLPTLFEHEAGIVHALQERLRTNIQLAQDILKSESNVQVMLPEGGWSLMLRLDRQLDEEELVLHLLNAGVLFHPGYFYGCEVDSYLIASLLPAPDRFQAGVRILRTTLSEALPIDLF